MTASGLRDEATKSRSFTTSRPRRKAARHAELDDVFVRAQGLADFLRLRPGLGVEKERGVIARLRDAREQFLLGLRAEAGQFPDAMRLASRFKFRDAGDAEFFVQHLDFFRAQRGNFHHRQQALGNRGAKLFVILELARLDQFGDLVLQRVADAGKFPEPILGHELGDIALIIIERAGGVGVGAGLEWVLALQLEQDGDFLKNVGDLRFVHGQEKLASRKRNSHSSKRSARAR